MAQPGMESYANGATMAAGGAFNFAAAASRLGLSVGFIGIVGRDMWSDFVLARFEQEGVSTTHVKVLDRPLPTVSVALNVSDDRGFITHEAEPEAIDRELFSYAVRVMTWARARHCLLHLVSALSDIAAVARPRGMTLSADAWGWEPWMCSSVVRELIPLSDVLLTNEPEARWLTGESDIRLALSRLAEASPYVVKRGPRGAIGAVRGRTFEVPTERVDVLDATGAGDCLNAGFVYGWLEGLEPRVCVSLGNICGGMNVRAPGGYEGSPSEEELKRRAAERDLDLAEGRR